MYQLSKEVITKFLHQKMAGMLTAREFGEQINIDGCRISKMMKHKVSIEKDKADYVHALNIGIKLGFRPDQILIKK